MIRLEYAKTCDLGGDQLTVSIQETANGLTYKVMRAHVRYEGNVREERRLEFDFVGDRIELMKVKSAIRKISIGIKAEYPVGTDGETNHLSIGVGFNALTMKWWCEVPEGWNGVSDLIGMILGNIAKANAQQTEQSGTVEPMRPADLRP